MIQVKYITVPNGEINRAQSVIDLLVRGYQILSAVGADGTIHYILVKE